MFKNFMVLVRFALPAVILARSAHATTIDTFTFTESNWNYFIVGTGVTGPASGVSLEGTFTGAVEPDGFIEQSDLSALSVDYVSNGSRSTILPINGLALFSFDTKGGVSSLDFAELPNSVDACVGAAASLDADCTVQFAVRYPVGTVGVVLVDGLPLIVSSDFPQITLESSVTRTPPAAAPEPRFCFVTGLVLIGIRYVRRCSA